MNRTELNTLRTEWINSKKKVYEARKLADDKKQEYIDALIILGNKKGVSVGLEKHKGTDVIFIANEEYGIHTLPENPNIINIILAFDNKEELSNFIGNWGRYNE